MSPVIIILALIAAVFAVSMLVAKNAITSALCLLCVLIMTAGIYGMIGEHLIATIQLVVYAGAIMVLFVFSIMLLNLNKDETDFRKKPVFFAGALAMGLAIFGIVVFALREHFANHHERRAVGMFTDEAVAQLGGNSKVLGHALFSQFYISFEVISLALLVAVVGAVVLAKRKID